MRSWVVPRTSALTNPRMLSFGAFDSWVRVAIPLTNALLRAIRARYRRIHSPARPPVNRANLGLIGNCSSSHIASAKSSLPAIAITFFDDTPKNLFMLYGAVSEGVRVE
jgi:hypothetical protein